MKMKNSVITICAGLFLIFMIQNTQVVSIRFLFWKLSMSRIILLTLVMFIGFLIGFFVRKKTER
ncbi:MAG: LapA family protein [Candidatus Omnitrophica bacterium]|nr:LapA family protein [Candidatus Omnitrophota bacterium]